MRISSGLSVEMAGFTCWIINFRGSVRYKIPSETTVSLPLSKAPDAQLQGEAVVGLVVSQFASLYLNQVGAAV